jgi:hypothetical protein
MKKRLILLILLAACALSMSGSATPQALLQPLDHGILCQMLPVPCEGPAHYLLLIDSRGDDADGYTYRIDATGPDGQPVSQAGTIDRAGDPYETSAIVEFPAEIHDWTLTVSPR